MIADYLKNVLHVIAGCWALPSNVYVMGFVGSTAEIWADVQDRIQPMCK